jgi:hypothetical protein
MAIGASILRPPPHALKRAINIGASKTTRKRIFMGIGKLFIFNKVACIISIFFPADLICSRRLQGVAGRTRCFSFVFFLDDDQLMQTTSRRLRPTVPLTTTVFSLVKRHAREIRKKERKIEWGYFERIHSVARERTQRIRRVDFSSEKGRNVLFHRRVA